MRNYSDIYINTLDEADFTLEGLYVPLVTSHQTETGPSVPLFGSDHSDYVILPGHYAYPEHVDEPSDDHLGASDDRPNENGSNSLFQEVFASGNQGIDGLLSGRMWAGTAITYSDPDSVEDYQMDHPEDLTDFAQLTADQLVASHFGLSATILTQNPGAAGFAASGFTGLDISYLGAGEGDSTIRLANTSDPNTAYAYYPSDGVWGGDAFFGNAGSTPIAGNYHWHTVLHEFGHSLGLAHGHTGRDFGPMPAEIDGLEYSLMTYRTYVDGPLNGYSYETFGAPQTFMMYDIAALQYMYGANFTVNNTDTVYSWTPDSGDTLVDGMVAISPGGNRIFATIWDGGGIDTYDLSAYTDGVTVDLRPGEASLFSSAQQAHMGAGNYAQGNIYNALQFEGDSRSLIENAIGGAGNDSLTGNAANNTLTGDRGHDTLNGEAGNDILDGGAQNDLLSGGLGHDNLAGRSGADILLGHAGQDSLNGGGGNDQMHGGSGIDILYGGLGDDILYGGGGLDTIRGDGGNDSLHGGNVPGPDGFSDSFVFANTFGRDTIHDFEDGLDLIDFSGHSNFNTIDDVLQYATDDGSTLSIRLNAQNFLIIENMTVAELDASDFVF